MVVGMMQQSFNTFRKSDLILEQSRIQSQLMNLMSQESTNAPKEQYVSPYLTGSD